MKLAWLCYDNGIGYNEVHIRFVEPDPMSWDKVVPIVYAVLVDQGEE
jgi:hypothetical protein